MEMSKTILGREPTTRTVQGKSHPQRGPAGHSTPEMLRMKPSELGGDCRDLSSSLVLPLEPLQNGKCRLQRRSLRLGISKASTALFAEPCAVTAFLPTGIVKDAVAVPQQSRHR